MFWFPRTKIGLRYDLPTTGFIFLCLHFCVWRERTNIFRFLFTGNHINMNFVLFFSRRCRKPGVYKVHEWAVTGVSWSWFQGNSEEQGINRTSLYFGLAACSTANVTFDTPRIVNVLIAISIYRKVFVQNRWLYNFQGPTYKRLDT